MLLKKKKKLSEKQVTSGNLVTESTVKSSFKVAVSFKTFFWYDLGLGHVGFFFFKSDLLDFKVVENF